VVAGAAFLIGGAGFGAVTSIFGMAAGTLGFTVAMAGLKLAGGILLNTIAAKLMGGAKAPRQETQRAELSQPSSLPPYRFAYGTCLTQGTPVDWVAKGDILWVCYLLNSRPSALTSHRLWLDKREAESYGTPFDLAGEGATVSNDIFGDHASYWIGRGDQTACPAAVVSGSEGHFASTDAWRGCTVLWARFRSGSNDKFHERWPAKPPNLTIEGDWSLVLDPRSGTLSASSNQALIVLDALRNNPLKPYAEDYLHLESFAWGADVAGQPVAVKSGGTIPRYCCDGVLVWSEGAEIEDQLAGLLNAGASRFVRVGGRLAFLPACPQPAIHTITDVSDGQPIQMTRWRASDQVYTEGAATYTAADRHYEAAEAAIWIASGAADHDGGLAHRLQLDLDFVTDARQAQRVAKIAVLRARQQRGISAELMPTAFDLVPGSWARVDLPAPYDAWNGTYEVEGIEPVAGVNDQDAITIRLPATLREVSGDIYAWDAASEEGDVVPAPPVTPPASVQPPSAVTLISGSDAALHSAGTVTPRIQIDWTASVSASALGYELQYRIGTGAWVDLGATGLEARRIWIAPVQVGSAYSVRIRTAGLYGRSDWLTSAEITAAGPSGTLATPVILSATGGARKVDLSLRQGADSAATSIELWRGTSNAVSAATLIASIAAGASVSIAHSDTGLSAGEHFYFARARNGYGAASPFTAAMAATVS